MATSGFEQNDRTVINSGNNPVTKDYSNKDTSFLFPDNWHIKRSHFPFNQEDWNPDGETVDFNNCFGRCFAIQTINFTSDGASASGIIQESSDGENWTATDGVFDTVSSGTSMQYITFNRTKRYVRHWVISGGSVTFYCSSVIGQQKNA